MPDTDFEPDTQTRAQGTSVNSPSRRLIGFTNNLLATSIVIVVAGVVGTQLVALWRPADRVDETSSLMKHWPTLEDCALRFGNQPYTIERSTLSGSESEANQVLQTRCVTAASNPAEPSRPMGNAEQRMISKSGELTPVAEEKGKWRVFQVTNPQGKSIPIFIGLRDDCSGQHSTRMVSWGLALAESDSQWNIFSCSIPNSTAPDEQGMLALIPPNCQRTLAIGGKKGTHMLGFVGGDLGTSKRFYQTLAEKYDWNQSDWIQRGNQWDCRFTKDAAKNRTSLLVQLATQDNDRLRGLIVADKEIFDGMSE